jgi:hypothetical protein
VSIVFLRAEPITGWVTLWSLFILVGMCWSLHKLPRS